LCESKFWIIGSIKSASEGKRSLGISRHRYEDNVEMNLKETLSKIVN